MTRCLTFCCPKDLRRHRTWRQHVSPKVENAIVPVPEEPTQEEIAEAGTDPDTPVDSSEVESDQGLQAAFDFVGH